MRDAERARKFAVKWSTKSKGEIANLAGCYLTAMKELEATREELARQRNLVLDNDSGVNWDRGMLGH